MASLINSWASQIVIAVIVVTILEMIIPSGNNKKYIKTVIGIYVVFIIVQPIITNVIDIDKFETILTSYSVENISNNNDIQENLTKSTNDKIYELYEKEIKDEIIQFVEENGFEIESIKLEIEEKSEENYGKINNLEIIITNEEKEEIKPIRINVENEIEEKSENAKINELKKLIAEEFELDEKNIKIGEKKC